MLDDIFANNEKRLINLRTHYSADTVASMVNERLEGKSIKDRVTGGDIDGFLKVSLLGNNKALISIDAYRDAMNLDGFPA